MHAPEEIGYHDCAKIFEKYLHRSEHLKMKELENLWNQQK
jgi:hypothetical protein